MNLYTIYEQKVSKFFAESGNTFLLSHCIFREVEDDVHARGAYFPLFQKETQIIVRCQCGFVFNSNRPSPDTLSRFYHMSEAMKSWANIKASQGEYTRQYAKFKKAIQFIVNETKTTSLLDVGAGSGRFLELLHKERPSIKLSALEMSVSALEVLKRMDYVTIHQKSFEDFYVWNTKRFEAISLWGVLEHVNDPIKTLSLAKDLLFEGGHLIICVPNEASLVASQLKAKCSTFCPQHLWYFNKATLTKALIYTGFEIKDVHFIENESLPCARSSLGFEPYERLPHPNFEKQVNDRKDQIDILMDRDPSLRYKIVIIARKPICPTPISPSSPHGPIPAA